MAEEKQENTEQKSGGGKGLIIVLIVLVLFLILAIAGGGYFLYSQGLFSPKGQDGQEVVKKEKPEEEQTFKTEINDLVLNITNARGKEKLMKLSFAIKSVEPTIVALVEENKAEIIDVVIAQISARSSEELLTVGGKNLLKDELIQDINEVLNKYIESKEELKPDSVKQILFTTFVIK